MSPGGVTVLLGVKRELEFVHREGGVGNVQDTENSSDIHFIGEDSEAWNGHVTCPGSQHQRQDQEPHCPSPQSSVCSFIKLRKGEPRCQE